MSDEQEPQPQDSEADPEQVSEEEKGYSDNPEGQGSSMMMWVVLGMGLMCSLCSLATFFLYMFQSTSRVVVKGRPFWRWGRAESPELCVNHGDDSEQGESTKVALADAWLRDAEAEHASIAAFSELQLSLLSLGAPPLLLSATAAAIQDEIRHADFCYAQASSYTNASFKAGPLKVGGSMSRGLGPRPLRLGLLALDSLFDGCLNEGVAARLAAGAALRCEGELGKALGRIAEDEARHAELAWEIVKWSLDQGGAFVESLLRRGTRRLEQMDAPITELAPGVLLDLWSREGQSAPEETKQAFELQRSFVLERLGELLRNEVPLSRVA